MWLIKLRNDLIKEGVHFYGHIKRLARNII